MIASRRGFLFGAGASLLAAPAIVRVAANLMPISTAWRADIEVWTATGLAMRVEAFNERILRPQMIKLANQIDALIVADLQRGYPWLAA